MNKEGKKYIMHRFASDYVTEEMSPGITRQIIGYDSNIMMVKVFFSRGAIGKMHSHPHQQISYILSGKFEVNIGGKIVILGMEDSFKAPSNIDHEVKCVEEGIILDTFSPLREDFIKKTHC
ncbi:MAG: cupin domain-containing protein [Calditrichaceae bacterium]